MSHLKISHHIQANLRLMSVLKMGSLKLFYTTTLVAMEEYGSTGKFLYSPHDFTVE